MQLHLQDVPPRNGRLWIRHGFKVFQRQPLALAGLFGMNVGGIPLAENPHGFWIVVALVAAFTLASAWVALRARNEP